MRRSAMVVAAVAIAATGTVWAAERPAGAGRPATAAAAPGESAVARAARLGAGTRAFVLLAIPRVGRVLVDCTTAGVDVRFRADRLLATADVVVVGAGGAPSAARLGPGRTMTPGRPAAALLQTWQIAPFAAAGVRVTTMTVAGRRLGSGARSGCAASAHAVTSADQGATRQG